ncbi:thiol-disulfide oxidoreductase DCC family protein [Tuwongella immobilis]|uniref:DUF393 domain-containing protein n=1 Tax=Tuwongella immobilis TaxID=692036 RepID=A0A6C2YQI4_9BACT|nr:DUF393 domain-containing protein [Tuwongella immobilis]VIP03900.1 Thiol-disulfide oxidoreductase OS=Rhodopirellula baltica WH47 GN=RBWH47_01848 PE=4 SV=1: DUF393 [Tuwongella immobilis]VTS05167.1 Thiol-disulfide oxidoreductase OS=Rhodopirellula baltica WH47 GN=RBWH47_01848 PE=4 SV=1: DUF393 [Tuwongella immobilis]
MESSVATPLRTDQGIVLFDGTCAFCRKSISILKKLDWRGKLQYQDATDQAHWPTTETPLQMSRLMEEMHVVTPDRKRVFAGFRAFRWIAGRLPLLMPLVPFFYIPGVPQLGQRIYLLIAKYRYQLVPCHDGVCSLPPRKPQTPKAKPAETADSSGAKG